MHCHLPRHINTEFMNLSQNQMFAQHWLTAHSTSDREKEKIAIHNRGIKINGICSHEKSSGVCAMCMSHATWCARVSRECIAMTCANRTHLWLRVHNAQLHDSIIIIIVLTRFGSDPTRRVDHLLCGKGNILILCLHSTTWQTQCGCWRWRLPNTCTEWLTILQSDDCQQKSNMTLIYSEQIERSWANDKHIFTTQAQAYVDGFWVYVSSVRYTLPFIYRLAWDKWKTIQTSNSISKNRMDALFDSTVTASSNWHRNSAKISYGHKGRYADKWEINCELKIRFVIFLERTSTDRACMREACV